MSYWKWKSAPSAGWLQLWLIKLEKRARHTWGDSRICLTGAAVAAHLHRLRGGNGPEMRACGINYGPAMSSTWSILSRTMIQQSQKEFKRGSSFFVWAWKQIKSDETITYLQKGDSSVTSLTAWVRTHALVWTGRQDSRKLVLNPPIRKASRARPLFFQWRIADSHDTKFNLSPIRVG